MATRVPASPSSPYDRVEVLMIRRSSNCDIMTRDEMRIQAALERYGYPVSVLVADRYGEMMDFDVHDSHVADVVMKWAEKFDVGTPELKKTLLVVTYNGHGSPGSDDRLFAVDNKKGKPHEIREEFGLSYVQAQLCQELQNSDLLWINDCCFASTGYADEYETGCAAMQMEFLGAGHGCVDILDSPLSFAKRVADNLDEEKNQTVQERHADVYLPGHRTGEGVYRLDAGDPNKSIVVAPLRQADGTIKVIREWMVEDVLGLDQDTCEPEESTWKEWVTRPATPPARVDEARKDTIELDS